MTMTKTGEIREGVTPPESDEKSASEDVLESHVSKRAADVAAEKIKKTKA